MRATTTLFGLTVALFVGVPTAHAVPSIGADAELAIPTQTGANVGFGGALRLGSRIELPLTLWLTPEVGASYHRFGGDGDVTTGIVRGFGGARLAIGLGVKPSAYVHLGWGSASVTGQDSSGGFTTDVGGALDITVLPLLDFGIHGGYTTLKRSNSGSFGWAAVGAHASLTFW